MRPYMVYLATLVACHWMSFLSVKGTDEGKPLVLLHKKDLEGSVSSLDGGLTQMSPIVYFGPVVPLSIITNNNQHSALNEKAHILCASICLDAKGAVYAGFDSKQNDYFVAKATVTGETHVVSRLREEPTEIVDTGSSWVGLTKNGKVISAQTKVLGVDIEQINQHSPYYLAKGFSPGGRVAIVLVKEKTVVVLREGRLIECEHESQAAMATSRVVACSLDGDVCTVYTKDNMVKSIDLRNGKTISRTKLPVVWCDVIGVAQNGKYIGAVSDGRVYIIYHGEDGKLQSVAHTRIDGGLDARGLSITNDGSRVAVGGVNRVDDRGYVYIWKK